MSELSKQALKVENNVEFPNNNSGLITPSKLRTFNEDMIDSTVNQTTYTSDSASWNATDASLQAQINALDASGSAVSVAALNAFTASQQTYNTNNDAKWATVGLQSGSWGTGGGADLTSLNAFTQSQDTKNATLATYTASVDTKFSTIGTQSGSWVNTSLNSFSASQLTKDSTLATYTGSNDTKWNTLGSQSGSWITESETSSFARTNTTNTFTADQTINANLNVSGTINAYKLNVTVESSSVIFSSGSNILGDAANDTQTLNGAVNIVNELTASGLHYPTTDNGVKSFMQTDGNGNLSLQYVDAVFETVRNMSGVALVKGTPIYISGSTGDNGNAYLADASDTSKMPAVYILGEDLNPNETGIALCHGLIEGVNTTGYPAGTIIYVAEGGGWTSSRPSGSASIVQVLGVVQFEGIGGQGVVINQLEATLPNLQTGYVWAGNGGNQPVAVATSSLVTTPTDITSLNAFTQSQELLNTTFATTGSNTFTGLQTINNQIFLSDGAIDGAVLYANALTNYNLYVNKDLQLLGTLTASLQEGYTWVGDSTGRTTLVATSSFGGVATLPAGLLSSSVTNFTDYSQSVDTRINNIVAGTGFATTGSNTFVGNQTITGSVTISGSAASDLIISGTLAMGGVNPTLSMSSSNGNSTINFGTGGGIIQVTSGSAALGTSATSTMTRYTVQNTATRGYQIGITGKPSLIGGFITNGNDVPSVYATRAGGAYPVIELQPSQSYTDGRVSIVTPLDVKAGLGITGSTSFTGSIKFVDRSGYDQNVYLGTNALGMGAEAPSPLAVGNTISVAIGNGAMRFASGSNQSVAIGNNALLITTGSKNFGLGSETLSSNTTGQENIAIGVSALSKNVDGSFNIAIGNSSGFNTSGSYNTFVGESSAYNITGSYNTILGRYTGTSGDILNNNIILADGQNNIKAQYSGSAWSFQDEIRLNSGGNKPIGRTSVSFNGSGIGTFTNSLINENSIILITPESNSQTDLNIFLEGQPTSGQVSLKCNVSSTAFTFHYLIINPTT